MAYVTVAEIKSYLEQLGNDPNEPQDTLLGDIANRATSIVEEFLTFSFSAYPSTATSKVIQAWGTPYLVLPAHQSGSVTTVVPENSTTPVTGYTVEDDGTLYIGSTYTFPTYAPMLGPSWGIGRFIVTAKWGYGPVPESVKEVVLEVAVNIWRRKDQGMWTDIIGADGEPGIRFVGGLTNQQRAILDAVKDRYLAGVQAI